MSTITKVRPRVQSSGPVSSRRPYKAGGRIAPYAFIAPFYILYLLFMVIPVIAALVLSLTSWVGLGSPTWVGARNYVNLLQDTSFGTALGNSLVYVLVAVFIVVPAALLIAQALNARGLKGRDMFRLAFFVPMVLSPIVIALVFSLLLDTNYGLLNSVLRALFGIGDINWLGTPDLAKVAVSFVKFLGYGLQSGQEEDG